MKKGMKLLIVCLLLVGIVLVITGYQKQNMVCPPPIIKYKFIPRTFTETQNDLPKVSDIFSKMFSDPDVIV